MPQEIIDVGDLPNDGTGDPLRTAFEKINNNFANLFTANANLSLLNLEAFPDEPTSNNFNLNIGQINVYNNNFIGSNTQSLSTVVSTPYIPVLTTSAGPYGNQEYINIGATPNDGQGDPLRVAFGKINNNFSNLFFTTTNTTTSYTVGLGDQIIFETDATEFTQAEFQIRSSDSDGPNSQNIMISAQIKNSGLGVRWTGYGTTFDGDALTRYDMDVVGGNVVIYAKPIANTVMIHFIASTITWQGSTLPGLNLQLDGYVDSILETQDGLDLVTEN